MSAVWAEFYDDDHEAFRSSVRAFVDREIAPNVEQWNDERGFPAELWPRLADLGVLGMRIPEEHGGGGVDDFRFRMVVMEELSRVGASSLAVAVALLDDLCAPYLVDLGTEEQQRRWLPPLAAGTATPAIAMTEPGAGSDLQGIRTVARRTADGWVLNGSKTFITNGAKADTMIVFARTGEPEAKASERYSLFVVEAGAPGLSRGAPLDTVGQRAENIAELFFSDVALPRDALLGIEGRGFLHLMERLPVERMSIAIHALAAAEQALDWTLDHVRARQAFGQSIGQFQHVRFEVADIATELDVTRAYVEKCVLRLNAGELTAVDAAKAKWWTSELLLRVTTRCLQLFGGYGYIREYPIAQLFLDSRVHTIYGGTTEIMKEIIGRDVIGRV